MKILYVDDEQPTLTAFLEQHAKDGVSVETCLDAREVVPDLSKRRKADLPDVIVMDLYATADAFDSPQAIETNKRVEELVSKIANVRKDLDELVKSSKIPVGISTLRELRACSYTESIPVILRTREGLALLGDEILSESIALGADWMLKGRGAQTERAIIERVVRESLERQRRLKRDVALMLIGTLLGALVSLVISALGSAA